MPCVIFLCDASRQMSKKRKELEEGWKARTQDLMSKEKRSVPPHAPACFRHTCIYAPPASFISCRKAERRASRDRVTARVIIRPPRERVRNDYGGRGASRHPPTHVVS